MSTETTQLAETTTASEADVRSNGYPSVTELLTRVMADVGHVGKDGYNKQQSYNFRGIDAVLNAVGPAFRTHGIVPKPILKDVVYENILVGEKRTPMTRCTVKVKYRFKGPGGDYEDVTVPGEAFDSGDKGTAKAMSVAYRIALIQLLALPTTEPDPDETSYERAPAAVTDQRWLAAVRQRIAGASDHDALTVIGADISAQADAGQLSMSDGDRLRAEFDARWTALATAARPSAWESQDQPAERHHGPVETEWNTASGEPLPPPAPGVPNATKDQITEMVRLLGVKRGVYNGQCARVVSELARRRIDDPHVLSQAEARSIIETLTAERDLVPLPDATAASADEAPGNAAGASNAQMRMMHALLKKGGHTHDGGHVLMSRVTGREIKSANDLTTAEASLVINALMTGEVPARPGPAPSDEGIDLMNVLRQIIDDAHSVEEFDQARADIEREHAEGGIGGDQLAALQAHWVDRRNEQLAKAGASA